MNSDDRRNEGSESETGRLLQSDGGDLFCDGECRRPSESAVRRTFRDMHDSARRRRPTKMPSLVDSLLRSLRIGLRTWSPSTLCPSLPTGARR